MGLLGKRGLATPRKEQHVKYYAVKNGIKPGIYTSWQECEENVKGYPKADFKSFPTKEQAVEYINKSKLQTSKVCIECGLVYDSISFINIGIKQANYCPMCGGKLKVLVDEKPR